MNRGEFRPTVPAGARAAISLNSILLILAAWAIANGVAYVGFEWYAASQSPSRRRPALQALSSFKAAIHRPAIPYRLMSPERATAAERYPLVVFLHGAGERGYDNQTQLLGLPEQLAEANWRKRFPCFVLAPQCPSQSYWTSHDAELIDLIREVIRQCAVDPERVYLTGLSMGGFGSWSLAAREPDLFAAVAPICGGGDPGWGAQLAAIPIWAVHGDADKAVPVERSREMIDAIRKAGGHPRYSELKGVGHNSWTETYRKPDGVLSWMFEQRNHRGGTASVK